MTLYFRQCLIIIPHLQELVEGYAAEAKATGKPQLMLTAAVSAGKGTIDAGYEIAEIAKYCWFLSLFWWNVDSVACPNQYCTCISRHLDFINVMTYDFHGAWERFTGHNSPLYRGSQDSGDLIYFNTVRDIVATEPLTSMDDIMKSQPMTHGYDWCDYDDCDATNNTLIDWHTNIHADKPVLNSDVWCMFMFL